MSPRPRVPDARFDFRGGVNLTYSEDALDSGEVQWALNARHERPGGWSKRRATQRIHDTVVDSGARIQGIFQWNPAGTLQVVIIAGGSLWYMNEGATDFTEVAPSSPFSTTVLPRFEVHRDGSTVALYIAMGNATVKFSGTAITSEDVTNSPNSTDLHIYKGRLFALDGTKALFATEVNEPESWQAVDGGFSFSVETYDTEGNTGLTVVGGSLLVLKPNNISRFTGNALEDVAVATLTEGVSSEVGLAAANTLAQFEEVCFLISDRGPYVASEVGVEYVGQKIEEWFRNSMDFELLSEACAGYNRSRREILCMLPSLAGEGENDTGWLFDLTTRGWAGPWVFPFGVSCICRYEREDGTESLLAGGYDGWVRDLDALELATCVDDAARAGTGGTAVELSVSLPPMVMGEPGRMKTFRTTQVVNAAFGVVVGEDTVGSLQATWRNERGTTNTIAIPPRGSSTQIRDHQFRSRARGDRVEWTFTEETASPCLLSGVKLVGLVGGES